MWVVYRISPYLRDCSWRQAHKDYSFAGPLHLTIQLQWICGRCHKKFQLAEEKCPLTGVTPFLAYYYLAPCNTRILACCSLNLTQCWCWQKRYQSIHFQKGNYMIFFPFHFLAKCPFWLIREKTGKGYTITFIWPRSHVINTLGIMWLDCDGLGESPQNTAHQPISWTDSICGPCRRESHKRDASTNTNQRYL